MEYGLIGDLERQGNMGFKELSFLCRAPGEGKLLELLTVKICNFMGSIKCKSYLLSFYSFLSTPATRRTLLLSWLMILSLMT
jgi:hypothetical protein